MKIANHGKMLHRTINHEMSASRQQTTRSAAQKQAWGDRCHI
jgi:hypothetical protein